MRPIGDKLVIATHNPGKLREIAALVEPLGITCLSAAELDLPDEEVGQRLTRLFARIGTSSRAEATSLAFRGLANVGPR